MSKKHPMSLSMDNEMHEALRKRAKEKKMHISEYARQLIGHFCLDREDIKPVVLQIPISVLSSRDSLKTWLEAKSAAMLRQLFPAEECKVGFPAKSQEPKLPSEQVVKKNIG